MVAKESNVLSNSVYHLRPVEGRYLCSCSLTVTAQRDARAKTLIDGFPLCTGQQHYVRRSAELGFALLSRFEERDVEEAFRDYQKHHQVGPAYSTRASRHSGLEACKLVSSKHANECSTAHVHASSTSQQETLGWEVPAEQMIDGDAGLYRSHGDRKVPSKCPCRHGSGRSFRTRLAVSKLYAVNRAAARNEPSN
eukprot:6189924-Pleurochrysis_carterae.AAC.1